jgi:hypothetical protein
VGGLRSPRREIGAGQLISSPSPQSYGESRATGKPEVIDSSVGLVTINVRALSGLPERRSVGVRGRVVGAVSIGSFELSRWRLRRTRWAMGFQSVRAGCRACLKRATETKGETALLLNIALES